MPPRFPPPPPGTVRVWLARLDRPPLDVAELRSSLAAEELARMERFAFDALRARYVVGRGLLRHVLAESLGVVPAAVGLAEGDNGRPVLAPMPSIVRRGGALRGDAARVAFNLSHAHDLLAIAIAVAHEDDAPAARAPALGVDVEVVREVHRMDAVAQRVFDDAEREAIASGADEAARRRTFHRLWTRKEACMKATGAGFTLPPHTFHVDAELETQVVALPAHACAPAGMTVVVHDLAMGVLDDDAAGALAIEAPASHARDGTPGSRPDWTVELRRA